MIPKIIHYCWFGRGEMPPLMKRCLKSWKKYCPNWEVVLWNEDNFDVTSTLWTKQAYEAGKYAFVSDYVRLKVLYEQGGVYMDTDVELVQSIDCFLEHEAFSGFESMEALQTGIIGAVRSHPIIARWLEYYKDRAYFHEGKSEMVPNVAFVTEDMKTHGLQMNDTLQNIDGMVIYPQTWFCPLSLIEVEKKITTNTHAIHHFTSTWRTEKARKDFARTKRHQTKWYRALIWLRYLPNRSVRKIFGDKSVDAIKQKMKK